MRYLQFSVDANALTLCPIGDSEMTNRIALMFSNILKEESHLDKYKRRGRSLYHRNMVNELARASWKVFQTTSRPWSLISASIHFNQFNPPSPKQKKIFMDKSWKNWIKNLYTAEIKLSTINSLLQVYPLSPCPIRDDVHGTPWTISSTRGFSTATESNAFYRRNHSSGSARPFSGFWSSNASWIRFRHHA
jgi:methylmalonyl-CoA mutase N-terminal domain/subunit